MAHYTSAVAAVLSPVRKHSQVNLPGSSRTLVPRMSPARGRLCKQYSTLCLCSYTKSHNLLLHQTASRQHFGLGRRWVSGSPRHTRSPAVSQTTDAAQVGKFDGQQQYAVTNATAMHLSKLQPYTSYKICGKSHCCPRTCYAQRHSRPVIQTANCSCNIALQRMKHVTSIESE